VVLQQGAVAREVAGGASERKKHGGAGMENRAATGRGAPLKGAAGR
jgi:hypothetical protein